MRVSLEQWLELVDRGEAIHIATRHYRKQFSEDEKRAKLFAAATILGAGAKGCVPDWATEEACGLGRVFVGVDEAERLSLIAEETGQPITALLGRKYAEAEDILAAWRRVRLHVVPARRRDAFMAMCEAKLSAMMLDPLRLFEAAESQEPL